MHFIPPSESADSRYVFEIGSCGEWLENALNQVSGRGHSIYQIEVSNPKWPYEQEATIRYVGQATVRYVWKVEVVWGEVFGLDSRVNAKVSEMVHLGWEPVYVKIPDHFFSVIGDQRAVVVFKKAQL